jgi:predicted GH43/DUF377 family glycosyl hydrolase
MYDEMKKIRPLGVSSDRRGPAILGAVGLLRRKLVFGHGHDRNFALRNDHPVIVLPLGKAQDVGAITSMRLSNVLDTNIITYSVAVGGDVHLRVALHEDADELSAWEVPALNPHLRGTGMVVSEYRHEGQYVLYSTNRHLRVAFSKNLVAWHDSNVELLAPRSDHFDRYALQLVSVTSIEQGLLVLYESAHQTKSSHVTAVGAALFAADNPTHLLWRSDDPIWENTSPAKWSRKLLGAIVEDGSFSIYYSDKREQVGLEKVPNPFVRRSVHTIKTSLRRSEKNPILSPVGMEWESQAVFNPAAFTDRGRVHLLYRALGPDGVSRIGYASSSDGIHFDERLDYPVYEPSTGFGKPVQGWVPGMAGYDPVLNPSGGGWAGCEDPRVVKIDGHAYMSFVAFDGWSFIRQALTSIPLEHLHQKNWQWRAPKLISKPGETNKNWVIFPEKINGKYAVLHGLSPQIYIDYVDSLDDLGKGNFIKSMPSHGGAGWHDKHRQNHWDNRVRGAGAPPIKTDMGWLLLYHATDMRDPGKYKLGAMLLDLKDPTKVLFRSATPVLEPKEWYENEGKAGVVYTCGAVILNNNLVVYYGGGDKHIAVARANAQEFIEGLMHNHSVSLERVGTVE